MTLHVYIMSVYEIAIVIQKWTFKLTIKYSTRGLEYELVIFNEKLQ